VIRCNLSLHRRSHADQQDDGAPSRRGEVGSR
jgi:hypothetical protein